ncbi:hypothetical protein GCM10008174_15270 [Methylopila turkensis]|uniref:Uncharacterized protein n=1 Tax=Methylopila turkensis TaxID=1437816 RepID=A0A9W6JLC4_9HYPH|nr:hypothetical protein GCM10008174_15270 [Methylopila turkensis]
MSPKDAYSVARLIPIASINVPTLAPAYPWRQNTRIAAAKAASLSN